ncbi:hypothetical protein RNJ44_04050 [Nakaseomyces bracarensis]|uniref:Serine/threonine-protein phosphatase n=1 Tax=Nakaseomyces bracarensis TaxID=273131 RepID=A0ABR4NTT0_9SACH
MGNTSSKAKKTTVKKKKGKKNVPPEITKTDTVQSSRSVGSRHSEGSRSRRSFASGVASAGEFDEIVDQEVAGYNSGPSGLNDVQDSNNGRNGNVTANKSVSPSGNSVSAATGNNATVNTNGFGYGSVTGSASVSASGSASAIGNSYGNGNGNDGSGFLTAGTSSNARRTSNSRRSSYNHGDLPPSMVQIEPKPPILRNSKTISSTSSFVYDENALTDDDDNINNIGDTSLIHTAASRDRNLSGTEFNRTGSVSSASRMRRRSDNGAPIERGDTPVGKSPLNRSNSMASSLLSRKSSFGSNGNTEYSTPLHSPAAMDGSKGDYFSVHSADGSRVETPGGRDRLGDLKDDNYRRSNSMSSQGSHSKSQLDAYPSISTDVVLAEANAEMPTDGKKKKPQKPIDIDDTIQKLLDAGYAAKRTKNVCLKNSEIAQICQKAREIFLAQPALLELSPSVKIVGDVHGQYGDLLRLFTKCGFPPMANYLFLGDYVDRGKQSLETILLLLCYKIKYPENFFLLRGNHECANVTRVYGFYDECKRRCNIKTWKTFIDTFNTLPLAAIVTGKIFCVHGGLSPVLNSMDEIRHVSRPTDVPDFGLINDLLWSDPTDSPNEWEDNERGVSYCYNKVAINKFLNKFGFDLVCRAHMVVEDGYEFFNDRSLVTVFSAPNYCGEFDNWGAVMSVSEGLMCSFELLDPLDSAALKQVMKKGRQERKLAAQQQQQSQD